MTSPGTYEPGVGADTTPFAERVAARMLSDLPPKKFIPQHDHLNEDGSEKLVDFLGPVNQCEHGYDHPTWAHACDGCNHNGAAA